MGQAQKIYVRSRTGGNYRRAGFTWTGAWAEIDVSKLSKEQAAMIKADAHLAIREKPPEEFAEPKAAPGFDAAEVSKPADIKALEAENADLQKALEQARQGSHTVEAQVRASVAEAVAELASLKVERTKTAEVHAAAIAERDAEIAKLRETVAAFESAATAQAVAAKATDKATELSGAAKADDAKASKPKA